MKLFSRLFTPGQLPAFCSCFNGMGESDYSIEISDVTPGDHQGNLDYDGDVDGTDLYEFIYAMIDHDLRGDFDESGTIDTGDLDLFAANFGQGGAEF